MSQNWYVYIVKCHDATLYTGITTDPERRLWQHNHCNKTGAKYTRVRRPVSLVYKEKTDSRSQASKREYEIKKLSRQEKIKLLS